MNSTIGISGIQLCTVGCPGIYKKRPSLPLPPHRGLDTTRDSVYVSRCQRPENVWPTADSRRDPTSRGQREGSSDSRDRVDGGGCRRYHCRSCLMQLPSCIWDTRDNADTCAAHGDDEGHASGHPHIYASTGYRSTCSSTWRCGSLPRS